MIVKKGLKSWYRF